MQAMVAISKSRVELERRDKRPKGSRQYMRHLNQGFTRPLGPKIDGSFRHESSGKPTSYNFVMSRPMPHQPRRRKSQNPCQHEQTERGEENVNERQDELIDGGRNLTLLSCLSRRLHAFYHLLRACHRVDYDAFAYLEIRILEHYLAASLEIKLKPKYCNLLFSKERQTPPFKSRAIEI